jgi:S-adenosylmethionine hydrolase
MARSITFLSDYGLQDEYVGVVHAVIARVCPEARVIDLAHGVPRQDVLAGALTLARALPFAPPGVHLAVVDPGVGSARRAVALRVAADERLLVGPDNGLLIPAARRFGGVVEAVEISRSPWRLEPLSATFAGRDLFAPVAARLAAGDALARAGDRIDPGTLLGPELPPVEVAPGELRTRAVLVDSYGNVALAAGAGELQAAFAAGARVTVNRRHAARIGRTFCDVPAGEVVVHADSGGAVALAVNEGSAAATLGIGRGDDVRITQERA